MSSTVAKTAAGRQAHGPSCVRVPARRSGGRVFDFFLRARRRRIRVDAHAAIVSLHPQHGHADRRAGAAADLVYDAQNDVVFWATESTIGVTTVPTRMSTSLVTNVHVGRIAIDSTHIYWTDPVGMRVWYAPRAGGSMDSRAAHGKPVGIAIDPGGLYWCNIDGSVWRIPR